jgi:hypothetical protein
MFVLSQFLSARRSALLIVAFASVGFAACGWVSFDTTVNIDPQVIPGSPAAAAAVPSATATTSAVALDSSDLPKNADLADSVKLRTLTLTITSPPGGTFDFVDMMSVTISAMAGSGLRDVELAAGTPAPGSNQLILTATNDIDLLPYIRAGATLRATGSGHAPIADTTVAGQAVLKVSI